MGRCRSGRSSWEGDIQLGSYITKEGWAQDGAFQDRGHLWMTTKCQPINSPGREATLTKAKQEVRAVHLGEAT